MNIIVVGGGNVGATLAARLIAAGQHVKLIDIRRDQLPPAQAVVPDDALVLGSGTDPRVLEVAGIRRADVVVAVTGADETNLVVASLARCEFGVPRTVARMNNPKNAWLFTREMGVDLALDQTDVIARMIAEELMVLRQE